MPRTWAPEGCRAMPCVYFWPDKMATATALAPLSQCVHFPGCVFWQVFQHCPRQLIPGSHLTPLMRRDTSAFGLSYLGLASEYLIPPLCYRMARRARSSARVVVRGIDHGEE